MAITASTMATQNSLNRLADRYATLAATKCIGQTIEKRRNDRRSCLPFD